MSEDKYKYGVYAIPDGMIGEINRYLKHGIKPGGFLVAVFSNDLMGAVGKADHKNMGNIPAYCNFMHNHMPLRSWGSPEIVDRWIEFKSTQKMVLK